MKKKLISVAVLLIFIILLVVFLCKSPGDEELIAQLFGISETEYIIVSVENELDPLEYNGSYTVILDVKEEQMDAFITEIKNVFSIVKNSGTAQEEEYTLWEDEPGVREMYRTVIRNVFQIKISDKDIIYESSSSVRRKTLINTLKPYTTCSYLVYSDPTDGIYKVYICYLE